MKNIFKDFFLYSLFIVSMGCAYTGPRLGMYSGDEKSEGEYEHDDSAQIDWGWRPTRYPDYYVTNSIYASVAGQYYTGAVCHPQSGNRNKWKYIWKLRAGHRDPIGEPIEAGGFDTAEAAQRAAEERLREILDAE